MHLFIYAVLVILMHAVHIQVQASRFPSTKLWIIAISSLLEHQQDLIHKLLSTIIPQVAEIAQDIKHRNILTKYSITTIWRFSHMEAHTFATKLMKCIDDNLI
ncbi:hypothetical protein GALMADRAFT_778788 [Galerina marginata CBS 339.88]|uniref:Secreted protein n=1 Tax=Galerina marginata (strain CBS 339.88) TaxID=685588 RepID=A0A067SYB6_GALM3|nr:hypothetical protein GALMADRAFT_778788 [Galerina marginata CBS 339.88]